MSRTTGSGERTFLLAAGALGVGLVLLAVGAVFKSNADFAERYVSRQLAEQRIRFSPVDALSEKERATPCLVENAGKPLTTGKQAECYANHFIGRHLKLVAGGKTYSEMRAVQTSLRDQVAVAQGQNDAAAVADLQRQLNEVNGKRQSLFEGESSRGMLLTSYGFSTLGTKAAQGAAAAFAGGTAVLVLSLVLFVRGALARRPRPIMVSGLPLEAGERVPAAVA